MKNIINIVSTALVADWTIKGSLVCTPLTAKEFSASINRADQINNFCGHPATTKLLNEGGLSIPPQLLVYEADGTTPKKNAQGFPQGAFWNGQGVAVAARPKGGVRGAQTGDTVVSTLEQLEFLQFEFVPA